MVEDIPGCVRKAGNICSTSLTSYEVIDKYNGLSNGIHQKYRFCLSVVVTRNYDITGQIIHSPIPGDVLKL